jgi:putative NADPH-quinone reductase
MHILIITAHPSPLGHTHRLANAYKESAQKAGHTVEVIDLYTSEYQLPFLTYTSTNVDTNDYPDLPARAWHQSRVSNADEVVIVHPMWWGVMPAILKNWCDNVLTRGFGFTVENGKYKGLLSPRRARVIVTSGAPAWLYWILLMPLRTIWNQLTLGFCGFKFASFTLFGSMSDKSEEEFAKDLEQVRALIS